MRIAVLGAGVVGTTTAYYLARAGYEVDVYDRQAAPALETSFANAGQISFGYSSPWAAPGVPLKALKWMFARSEERRVGKEGRCRGSRQCSEKENKSTVRTRDRDV